MANFDVRHFLDAETFINRSVLNNNEAGLLNPSKFMCLLNSPINPNDFLEWNVISIDCPNISVSTEFVEVNSWIHYYLKTREDNDLSITFHDDASLSIRRFFYDWINKGFNHKTVRRSYIDEVCASYMDIVPLHHDGTGTTAERFEMVFPYEINSLDYDLAAENSVLKTVVKFKYRFHTIMNISSSDSKHLATKQTK